MTVGPGQPRRIPTYGSANPFAALFSGTGTISGQWVDLAGPGAGNDLMVPHAALVEAPPPSFAGRDILPLSTGVPILPTQSAQITGRPQVRGSRGVV